CDNRSGDRARELRRGGGPIGSGPSQKRGGVLGIGVPGSPRSIGRPAARHGRSETAWVASELRAACCVRPTGRPQGDAGPECLPSGGNRPLQQRWDFTEVHCPMPETLFEKVWNRHIITATEEATLLYIDRHLVHEVTSPQAFDGLRLAGRRVRRPDLTYATIDHNVPTENQFDIRDPLSRRQVETLRSHCRETGVTLYDVQSGHQGIVHVIGPELG